MNSIDDLIRDIREDEAIELQGSLDAAAEWRIEEKILQAMKEEPKVVQYRKPNRKRWIVLVAAAVLILALGLTSAARNEWDIALINFMGLSNADTLQLEGGEVKIDQSATDSGITLTAVSSIGDKNSAYIRLETDYELPEGFNPETDYILPWNISLNISDGEDHNTKDFGSTWMYYEEDGKLCFLLSISNCENLNKSRIMFKMKDLYLHHDLNNPESDVEEELICEGLWELDWKYHYESNAHVYRMLETFENNGVKYYLTKVEISPISIRIEAFREPEDRSQGRPRDMIQRITYEDGTYVDIPGDSSGGVRDGMFIDSFVDTVMMGEVLRSDEVKSITICGTEIEL